MQSLRPEDCRMPAEWEPHRATWLAWPHQIDDFGDRVEAVRWIYTEIIRQLVGGEEVRLIVSAADKPDALAKLEAVGAASERVSFFEADTDRSWTRDFMPLGVVSRSIPRALVAIKWRFNGWARYSDHQLDEQAGQMAARAIASEHGTEVWSPMYTRETREERVVLEGGAVDVDGGGTLLATENCLLGSRYCRNSGLDRVGTETLLQRYLGVRRVVWLSDGIAGDDTSGHIDDFARFVAPGKVVVAAESRQSDPNYIPLGEARERLLGARDAEGQRLEVIALPMPEPRSLRGERLPASYANFYIANRAVLVPTFNDPADRTALGILGELFPDRQVVGVYAGDLVIGLGTLHCSTQQEPRVPLFTSSPTEPEGVAGS